MNHQNFHTIFHYSYDGILLLDHQGKVITANNSYLHITGTKLADILGKSYLDIDYLHDVVTPKILKDKRPKTIINFIREKGILVTGNPVFDESGNIINIIINVRDISILNDVKIESLLSIALEGVNNSEVNLDSDSPFSISGVVAKSPKFLKIIQLASKIAKVDSTVLLLGESGVGKEVITNLVHSLSSRHKKPLIKVNCAAIPSNLIESELFGYEKGAFTGANQDGRVGLFEKANGGTILLDEIGDTPMSFQIKLLRVLQEQEITRVGGTKNIPIDVRIIAATNKNLKDMVEKEKFRKDLYYRLNIIPIKIPSLRDRKEDIVPLAYSFLQKINDKYNLKKDFHPTTLLLMEEHDWPGNIRELENLIERIAVSIDHDEILWSDLPFIPEHLPVPQPDKVDLRSLLKDVEKKVILQKLEEFKTTRKTAESLGISQSSLVKKLQTYKDE